MAFMGWWSVLGPGRILLLLIACFITFSVHRALQQKTTSSSILFIVCIAETPAVCVILEAEPVLLVRPHPVRYPVRYTSLA